MPARGGTFFVSTVRHAVYRELHPNCDKTGRIGQRGKEKMLLTTDPFSILTVVVAPARTHQCLVGFGPGNEQSPGARGRPRARRDLATGATRPGLQGLSVLRRPTPRPANARATIAGSAALLLLGLGLFASSAIISIAGSIVVYYGRPAAFVIAAGIGVVCGASAVIAMVCGSVFMIRETQLAVKGLVYATKSHASQ